MKTYFNLDSPQSEHLLADIKKGAAEERQIVHCPNGHLAVYRRLGELVLKVKHNNRDETIIWPWISGWVIHERLLADVRQRGLTGYQLRPPTVGFSDGGESKDYRELVVTGWAGVPRAASGIRLLHSCRACIWS